jgi:hypothetical protein
MRGTASFVLELMPILMGLCFLAMGILLRGSLAGGPRRIYLPLAAWALVFGLMGQRYLHQLAWRHGLAALTPERVRQVQVEGRLLPSSGQLDAVLASLREAEWFSPNHGGWGRMVPMVVTLSDGTIHRYRVARYTREVGTVIAFERSGLWGTWSDGYAFSPGLPQALAAAGAPLP